MNVDIRELTRSLFVLEKKAEEIDGLITEVRIEMHNLYWNIVEFRNKKFPNNQSYGI